MNLHSNCVIGDMSSDRISRLGYSAMTLACFVWFCTFLNKQYASYWYGNSFGLLSSLLSNVDQTKEQLIHFEAPPKN